MTDFLEKELTPLFRRIMSDLGDDSSRCEHCGIATETRNAILLAQRKLIKHAIDIQKTLVVAETRETRSERKNLAEYTRLEDVLLGGIDQAALREQHELIRNLQQKVSELEDERRRTTSEPPTVPSVVRHVEKSSTTPSLLPMLPLDTKEARIVVECWWKHRIKDTPLHGEAVKLLELEHEIGIKELKKRLQRWWQTMKPLGRLVFHETTSAGNITWQNGKAC